MAAAENLSALQTQVGFLERGHDELRKNIHTIDSKMDAGFEALSKKLDAKTSTNWQPISIMVAFLTSVGIAIGAALYYPIRENMAKQESQIDGLRRDAIERERFAEGRIVKLWDDHNKTVRDLAYLQGQLHPLPPR
jgi:hypothetical protein